MSVSNGVIPRPTRKEIQFVVYTTSKNERVLLNSENASNSQGKDWKSILAIRFCYKPQNQTRSRNQMQKPPTPVTRTSELRTPNPEPKCRNSNIRDSHPRTPDSRTPDSKRNGYHPKLIIERISFNVRGLKEYHSAQSSPSSPETPRSHSTASQ